jgi:hypothetical protein
MARNAGIECWKWQKKLTVSKPAFQTEIVLRYAGTGKNFSPVFGPMCPAGKPIKSDLLSCISHLFPRRPEISTSPLLRVHLLSGQFLAWLILPL